MKQTKVYLDGIETGVTTLKLFFDYTNPEDKPTAEIERYYGNKEWSRSVVVTEFPNVVITKEKYYIKAIVNIGAEVIVYLTSNEESDLTTELSTNMRSL